MKREGRNPAAPFYGLPGRANIRETPKKKESGVRIQESGEKNETLGTLVAGTHRACARIVTHRSNTLRASEGLVRLLRFS
jgi:hypothetical protein